LATTRKKIRSSGGLPSLAKRFVRRGTTRAARCRSASSGYRSLFQERARSVVCPAILRRPSLVAFAHAPPFAPPSPRLLDWDLSRLENFPRRSALSAEEKTDACGLRRPTPQCAAKAPICCGRLLSAWLRRHLRPRLPEFPVRSLRAMLLHQRRDESAQRGGRF